MSLITNTDYFWQASVEELKRGYYADTDSDGFTCLICGRRFANGVIHPLGDALYTAEKAAAVHVREAHGDMFHFFLTMGKVYTGLTAHQQMLMELFYAGEADKDIAAQTDATSTSTIRNQRFAFREKAKQAKIIVTLAELLEEQRNKARRAPEPLKEGLIDIHRTATMLDERFAITQAEKDEVLSRYFNPAGELLIKRFPPKEKRKIIILQYLAARFERNRRYTEKEVNAIVGAVYEDIPTVRRYLVQYGFLDREKNGSAYWVKE